MAWKLPIRIENTSPPARTDDPWAYRSNGGWSQGDGRQAPQREQRVQTYDPELGRLYTEDELLAARKQAAREGHLHGRSEAQQQALDRQHELLRDGGGDRRRGGDTNVHHANGYWKGYWAHQTEKWKFRMGVVGAIVTGLALAWLISNSGPPPAPAHTGFRGIQQNDVIKVDPRDGTVTIDRHYR
jgi:hypothetical protein